MGIRLLVNRSENSLRNSRASSFNNILRATQLPNIIALWPFERMPKKRQLSYRPFGTIVRICTAIMSCIAIPNVRPFVVLQSPQTYNTKFYCNVESQSSSNGNSVVFLEGHRCAFHLVFRIFDTSLHSIISK